MPKCSNLSISFCITFLCSSHIGYGLTKNGVSSFSLRCTFINGHVPILSLRLKTSWKLSVFVKKILPFLHHQVLNLQGSVYVSISQSLSCVIIYHRDLMLCCSNVVQVPLNLNPFQINLEFGSPIKYITSHRISCCSVAFIEIKFQQKLCFNNQVSMLPSHSQRQCFKTDQVMQNAQILCVHSLI